MNFHYFSAASLALMLATPAFANPHADKVIGRLQSEGYGVIEQERTWLGRIRISAEKGNEEREIILNRTTGEILRDYSEHENDDDDSDDADEDDEDLDDEMVEDEDGHDDDLDDEDPEDDDDDDHDDEDEADDEDEEDDDDRDDE